MATRRRPGHNMEHLPLPRRPFVVVKAPFLGLNYTPSSTNSLKHFEQCPQRQGWVLEVDQETIKNYNYKLTERRSIALEAARYFLHQLLELGGTLAPKKLSLLQNAIAVLDDVISGMQAKEGHIPRVVTTIEDGAHYLQERIEITRRDMGTREALVELYRQ